jgi:hypothetical protein
MRRMLGVVARAALLEMFPASVAHADPPKRVPLLDFPPFTVTDICTFDVLVTQLTNNEVTTIYEDGRQTTTGQLKVRLTNIDTNPNRSIDVNISGPVTFTLKDGSYTAVYRGRFPNDKPEQGIFWVASGRVVMTVNQSMTIFSLVNVVGTTLDVWEALA